MVYLRLLGPVSVDLIQRPPADQKLDEKQPDRAGLPRFRSRKTVALLGYLAAEQRAVGREYLAGFFWPDESLSDGRACLRRELYNLGQILPDCWVMDRQKVSFVPELDTKVDLYTILELVDQERWQEASDLIRGDFLEGLYLDNNAEFELWLLSERDRWRICSEDVLGRLIQSHTRRGRYTIALQHAQQLLQLAPWNEKTHRLLMQLLAWTGKRGAALRQFEQCRQVLDEELNGTPAEETVILYRKIQAGELDLPPQLPAFLTSEKARHEARERPFVGRKRELSTLDAFLNRTIDGQPQVAFITGGPGRGKTALLNAFSSRSMEDQPRLLVAGGRGNAYSGMGDPFLLFREVMAMLTGDVEKLWDAGTITRRHAERLWTAAPLVTRALIRHGTHLIDVLVSGKNLLSRARTMEGEDSEIVTRLREVVYQRDSGRLRVEQSQLFQQFTNVLADVSRTHPLLLKLDDIQWADPVSISLIFYLGRSLSNLDSKILLVGAYRPEEIPLQQSGLDSDFKERHPLARVLSEFKRIYGDVWIDLSQPEEKESRVFIDELLDTEPNQLSGQFRDTLFRRTEGHPLFTIELLRTMQEGGDLMLDSSGSWMEGPDLDWSIFPARVEAVIEDRVNRLDPALQQVLGIASVEGESFTAEAVSLAGDIPEDTVLHQLSHDLERRHRLVQEREEIETGKQLLTRFRFSHALFQEYLYNRLSQGERRLWHGRLGEALESLYQGEQEDMAIKLAHHFDLADDHRKAFQYYALAAEQSSRLYAAQEVLVNYTKAIELAEIVSPKFEDLVGLYRGRGLISGRLGNFNQAQRDHQTVLQLARAEGEKKLEWRAFIDLGRLWAARDYYRTQRYFQGALELSRNMNDPIRLANSLNWMGNWHTNVEKLPKAINYHHQALEIVERLEDQKELANTLDLLGVAKLMEGDLGACIDYYDRAITLQREQDDRLRLVSSLTGRSVAVSAMTSMVCVPVIPPPDGIKDSQEAIEIADQIGDLPGKAWALYAQGVVHLVRGRVDLAEKALREGLKLSLEIKHQEYIVANRFGLGLLYQGIFTPEIALVHLKKALPISEKLRSPAMIHNTAGPLAGALIMIRDFDGAQSCLEKVLSPGTRMDTLGKRTCWLRKGELDLVRGKPTQSLKIIDRLIAAAAGLSSEKVITQLWMMKGKALMTLDQAGEALPWLQSASQNTIMSEERFIQWQVQVCLGQAYRALGRESEAENVFQTAKEMIEKLAGTISDQEIRIRFLKSAQAKIGSIS